jgi:hypothetical protein
MNVLPLNTVSKPVKNVRLAVIELDLPSNWFAAPRQSDRHTHCNNLKSLKSLESLKSEVRLIFGSRANEWGVSDMYIEYVQ